MKHDRTSPYYMQRIGKIERCHHTLKSQVFAPVSHYHWMMHLLSLDIISTTTTMYVLTALKAKGYIAPLAKLEGREKLTFKDRDRKLVPLSRYL